MQPHTKDLLLRWFISGGKTKAKCKWDGDRRGTPITKYHVKW